MEATEVYKNYFERYTSLVNERDIRTAFANQVKILNDFFTSISEKKADYAYAESKWTLKEMLQHMIDTERIFAYRALAIARNETAVLPGFDENTYAANSSANTRTWADLTNEMKIVRESTTALFNSFTEHMLTNEGHFSTVTASPNTVGNIIIGHFYHHVKIANERYLN